MCVDDDQVSWFSFDPDYHIEREQMCCYLTRTTKRTHQLIKENLHETPTYGGWVEAKGPRYCPSIEDKVFFILSLINCVRYGHFAEYFGCSVVFCCVDTSKFMSIIELTLVFIHLLIPLI